MQLLVTGGAGFIGGHLAETFVREGHDVTVLDNFDPYYDIGIKERTVEAIRSGASTTDGSYELVRGDVRDVDLVSSLVGEAEIVVHQAAQAGVRTSVENPRKPHDINVTGTLNVLDAARNGDVERVINASSSSVYGKPVYLPYDEEHPTSPVSPYGASKLAAEHYARVYYEVYGLSTVSLRYFTVYGPRMRPNMAITNFVSRCLNDEPPVIFGDGKQTRDFTYVDDVVRANRTLLRTDAADGEVLNVGSTGTITVNELAAHVVDVTGADVSPVHEGARVADARHTHANVSTAASLLGYEPTTSIRNGVARFVDWYERNREWYEPLVLRS